MKYPTTGQVVAFGLGILLIFGLEFSLDRFGASVDFSSNFFATILGAVIALFGTWIIIERDARVRRHTQSQLDATLVSEIFTKCQQIVNNFIFLRDYISASFAGAPEAAHANPATFVLPLAALPDPVTFTPAEKALFLRLRRVELANDVAEWGPLHNMLIGAFATYATERAKLNLGAPSEMHGAMGRHELSDEQLRQIMPLLATLNGLVFQMRDRAEAEYRDFKPVFDRIRQETERQLSITLDIPLPD